MQRDPPVPFQVMLWPLCPHAISLPALSPAFARSCPWESACPEQHLLPSLPALGQGTGMSPPAKPQPCSARCHPLLFPSGVFFLLCQAGPAASTAGVLPAPACPHHRRLPPAAEPCSLPLDEGDCQHYTLRWYYNQRVTECRPFVYSGCRGNLNRFDSKEECELHCGQRLGAGRHATAQPPAPAGPAASPPGAVGSGDAEPGGRC